MGITVAYWRCT